MNVINGTTQLTVKTDKGEAVTVMLGEKTRYLRVMPGEKDLKNASRIAGSELSTGDRVLALGSLSPDGKTLTASSVIVMSKTDIARKQEHDRAEWQTRGIAGVISAVNADTREFTVAIHTQQGAQPVVIESAAKVDFRRYAPDSVRFSEAKPSSFAELKVGDHVRVLGEKNADGSRMKPEAVVSGSFSTLAGTVNAVDAAAGEIRIIDLATKKPLIVKVNADTAMHRLPPPMAMSLARRYNPSYLRQARADGGGGPRAGGGNGEGPRGPRGGAAGGEEGAGRHWSGSQGADLQQALEHVPPMPITELNKGDAIMISSATGADAARVTAIFVVAGVEPLLTRAASGDRQLSLDWQLDMGLPQ